MAVFIELLKKKLTFLAHNPTILPDQREVCLKKEDTPDEPSIIRGVLLLINGHLRPYNDSLHHLTFAKRFACSLISASSSK